MDISAPPHRSCHASSLHLLVISDMIGIVVLIDLMILISKYILGLDSDMWALLIQVIHLLVRTLLRLRVIDLIVMIFKIVNIIVIIENGINVFSLVKGSELIQIVCWRKLLIFLQHIFSPFTQNMIIIAVSSLNISLFIRLFLSQSLLYILLVLVNYIFLFVII